MGCPTLDSYLKKMPEGPKDTRAFAFIEPTWHSLHASCTAKGRGLQDRGEILGVVFFVGDGNELRGL